jgi:hypothetical protein
VKAILLGLRIFRILVFLVVLCRARTGAGLLASPFFKDFPFSGQKNFSEFLEHKNSTVKGGITMSCQNKKESGICCGKVCFEEHEFRDVAEMMIATNKVSRVLQKARRIDDL